MNVFLESNYQSILRKIVEERKRIDSKFNFQAIADATRIPKSYLSKVVGEKAHFSPDQLFLVCEYLGLPDLQQRYLVLLLEHERSTVKRRKEALHKEIQALRDRALDSREHLQAKSDALSEQGLRDYYLDPLNQLVQMGLSISRYQTDPQRLATDLGIQVAELRTTIAQLETLGIVALENGRYRTLIKGLHLPKSSPVFKAWRNQVKFLCLDRLTRRAAKDDYSYSVTFSATEKVRDKIKADFLDLLKNAEASVQGAKQEEGYQMSFDLFSWTK